jgi:hypothetical protein
LDTLKLASNKITSLKDLSFLKEMKCLKNLDLENNLVTKEKGYREAVWNLCPSLVVLDNHDREGQE